MALTFWVRLGSSDYWRANSTCLTDGGFHLPASASDLPNIKGIKITVNVQSSVQEMDGTFPTITLASEAKINN